MSYRKLLSFFSWSNPTISNISSIPSLYIFSSITLIPKNESSMGDTNVDFRLLAGIFVVGFSAVVIHNYVVTPAVELGLKTYSKYFPKDDYTPAVKKINAEPIFKKCPEPKLNSQLMEWQVNLKKLILEGLERNKKQSFRYISDLQIPNINTARIPQTLRQYLDEMVLILNQDLLAQCKNLDLSRTIYRYVSKSINRYCQNLYQYGFESHVINYWNSSTVSANKTFSQLFPEFFHEITGFHLTMSNTISLTISSAFFLCYLNWLNLYCKR